jgi:hypothetical protein
VQTTQSLAFEEAYSFSLPSNGFTFLAPLLGIWSSMLFCGVFSDKLVQILSCRQGGNPPPEYRLLVLGVTAPIGIAGAVLFGACTQARCHWIAPLIGSFMGKLNSGVRNHLTMPLTYSSVLFGFVAANSIAYAYLLDVYEARMDDVMVIFNGIKNFAAFGATYAIVPWITRSGYTVPFVVMAIIFFMAHMEMVFLFFKGAAIRSWSATKFDKAKKTAHGDAF